MTNDEVKLTPNLRGRKLRAIALGSEGYAIRFEGGVRDPLCRGMVDLRSYPFFTSKAIAALIVRAVNEREELVECLRNACITKEVTTRWDCEEAGLTGDAWREWIPPWAVKARALLAKIERV